MINFNTGPYFDDFDPSKNFHRILFKPGAAVQARELTQSQTILQNQISEFASAIYSQNTPISGGQVTVNQNCYYLKLNTTFSGATVTASNFTNQIIQSSDGTVLARVIATAETTTVGTTVGDPPTLIVSYLSGSQFKAGDNIQSVAGSFGIYYATVSTSATPATGTSSVASIADGVFYIVNGYSISNSTRTKYSIGNFVNVTSQTIILDKYDSTPSYRIGLEITENIYDYVNDVSLLDPAVGAANYQAPGADRYQITLTLVTLPLTLGNDDQFIELVRVENGNIVKQVDGTVYSTIDDYFAKRDYETNGDYIVNDFKLTPSANSLGIATKYDLNVGKGVAYVHGYRVENQSPVVLSNDRARTTTSINNNAVYVNYGNYYTVDTANGLFDIGSVPQVDLHCVPAASIQTANANTYTSTLVGSAYMRNFVYVSGTGSQTNTYIYNAFINDFNLNSLSGTANGSLSSTNTIVVTDNTYNFSNYANAYFNASISVTTGGVTDVRNITNYQISGLNKTFTVDNLFTVTPTSSSKFTLLFQQYDVEAIVKQNGSYGITANCNINTAIGKVNGISTGDAILYNPGEPELIFKVGQPYVATLTNSSYYSQRVYHNRTFSGNQILLQAQSKDNSNIPDTNNPLRFEGNVGALAGTTPEQLFTVIDRATGNILDFTTSGNTISIVTDGNGNKITANLYSTLYNGKNVDIIAQVQVSSGDSSSYVLKSKSLIQGNTAFVSGSLTTVTTGVKQDLSKGQVIYAKSSFLSSGKMSLYVNDVKKIDKIIDSGVAGTDPTGSLSNYADITNYFSFDNGQRDSFYDHASISLLPGAPTPVGNILIVFDYYSHTQASSGDGYFSIQSYKDAGSGGVAYTGEGENYMQIPTYTAKSGAVYKLAECIDFRPCRQNGQTAYVWEYSTSGSDIGTLIPSNASNFTSNYSFYLARQDKLVLTKDKSFQIIQGTPSTNPSLPTEPSGSLVLANLIHDPYTGYVPGEAPAGVTAGLSVNKVIHKRWAKTDITDLESRINNLEYYTSLNILEQNAQSLQVPDVNGLNRFKNGILVDNFSTYSTADTYNPDFAANINVRENKLGPLQFVDNFQLQNPTVLSSLGTLSNTASYTVNSISGTQTNIFTLPYTSANVVVQPLASSSVSVNPFSVSIQQGVAQLNPPMDNWVDNTQAPAILVTDPSMQVYQATGGVNVLNSGDYQTIPGTSRTTTSSQSYINHGTLSNSPYGSQIGYTSTTTSTYADQLKTVTSSAYNPLSTSFGSNNGYITNIAVLPYIRSQQIVVRAKGLLTNSNVHTFFDGVDVSKYMSAPNTIELTGVNGTFHEDDVVGFYVNSTFYPIARVVSVYNYPNGTQSRLYVGDIVNAANTVGTTIIQNGLYGADGNYIPESSTANGSINGASTPGSVMNLSATGSVGGVGGSYANVYNSGAATQVYASPIVQGYSSFLNNYGVWGDSNNSTTYTALFPVKFPAAGNYTIIVGASGTATVTANGSTVATALSNQPANTTTATYTASGAYTANVGWSATSSGTTQSAFGMTIADANTGSVVFSTTNPPNLTYTNAGTEVVMPGGGSWFGGATQVRLDPSIASNVANYYVGSQITFESKYVYTLNVAATYVPPAPAPVDSGWDWGGTTWDGGP